MEISLSCMLNIFTVLMTADFGKETLFALCICYCKHQKPVFERINCHQGSKTSRATGETADILSHSRYVLMFPSYYLLLVLLNRFKILLFMALSFSHLLYTLILQFGQFIIYILY